MGLSCVAGALALTVATPRCGCKRGWQCHDGGWLAMIVGAVALGVASYFTEDIQVTMSARLLWLYSHNVPGLAATLYVPARQSHRRDQSRHIPLSELVFWCFDCRYFIG